MQGVRSDLATILSLIGTIGGLLWLTIEFGGWLVAAIGASWAITIAIVLVVAVVAVVGTRAYDRANPPAPPSPSP